MRSADSAGTVAASTGTAADGLWPPPPPPPPPPGGPWTGLSWRRSEGGAGAGGAAASSAASAAAATAAAAAALESSRSPWTGSWVWIGCHLGPAEKGSAGLIRDSAETWGGLSNKDPTPMPILLRAESSLHPVPPSYKNWAGSRGTYQSPAVLDPDPSFARRWGPYCLPRTRRCARWWTR